MLISIDILLGHSHDTLVVLLNHIHIVVELGTVHALNLKAVSLALYKEFTGNGLVYCNGSILEFVAILIDTLLHNLYDRQVLVFGYLPLAQTATGIGQKVAAGSLIVLLDVCHKLVIGVVPVVVAHVCLHKRWLCCIVERLCERCDIRQITDHLVVDIVAELSCAEIDIACIGKRAVYLLVTRK